MFVAQKLKSENLAEYLIYMWQTEDLLRACNLDIDIVESNYLSKFQGLNETQKEQQHKWYCELIDMMRSEGVSKKGHLQINKNVISELEDFHKLLIDSEKFSYYRAAYFKALPLIIELRCKSGIEKKGELETCFNFLYGVLLLKMKQSDIGKETQEGLQTISTYISMLCGYYKKNQESPLDFG